jgi:hypothetical protein
VPASLALARKERAKELGRITQLFAA